MSILSALTSSPVASALELLNTQHNKSKSAAGKATPAVTGSGTGTSNGSGTDAFSVNNLGSTFLNLLVQELQNQDPTSPMDPTAMVGQMISLNQLSQLISINTALTSATSTGSTTPTSGSAGSVTGSGPAANATAAAVQAGLTALSPGVSASAASSTTLDHLPSSALNASQASAFDPGGVANPASFGRIAPVGTPSKPLDLSNVHFVLGGK